MEGGRGGIQRISGGGVDWHSEINEARYGERASSLRYIERGAALYRS